jgi:nitrite reductase/ring-hydroxylating ferredoxin subunit
MTSISVKIAPNTRASRSSRTIPHVPGTCRHLVVMNAGFGAGSKQTGKNKSPKLARYLDVQQTPSTSASNDSGWFQVQDVSYETSFVSKPIKAVILDTGKAICLYKVDTAVYCSDANSTAFKYPLSDASIIQLKNGQPAVEVKLDGTVYELKSGRVVSWCPKNSLVRNVLGSLKDKTEPEDLPVYPVEVRGDDIWVNLSRPL